MRTNLYLIVLTLLALAPGCAGVKNSMRLSEKDSAWNPVKTLAEKRTKGEDEPEPAQTMAAIWTSSVYEKPGEPTIRGFGGRVFFYDGNSNAVPAKGELVVYCFDEDSEDPSKPTRKAVFRQSEFQSHLSDSGLGPSYSVWVPWDQLVGSYRKSVTLIPVFRTTDGRIIKSGQSINVLDGKVRETNVGQDQTDHPFKVLGASSAILGQGTHRSSSPSGGVSQAGFEQSSQNGAERTSSVRTSTIELTPNLRRQLLDAQQSGQPTATGASAPTAPAAPQNFKPAESPATSSSPNAAGTTPARVFGAPGAFR